MLESRSRESSDASTSTHATDLRASGRGAAIVQRSGGRAGDNSFQESGTEIGASGFARVEYAAIDVFVRLLRR